VKNDLRERAQAVLGITFNDAQLLKESLTHASIAENRLCSNERMEFLGDAVLDLVVCAELYRRFPTLLEGDLTKIKSAVVSRRTCAEVARETGLAELLIIGKGISSRDEMPSSLAAAVYESIVAAIYLDGGIEPARAFIERQIRPLLADVRRSPIFGRDHKSALQERLQGQGRSLPTYRISSESGPDHQKVFHVDVRIDGQVAATGSGRTKKDAEQEAARLALATLEGPQGGFE